MVYSEVPVLFEDSVIAPAPECRGTAELGTVEGVQRTIYTVLVGMISSSHSTSAA